MSTLAQTVVAGLASGSAIAAIIGVIFHHRARQIEQQIKNEFDKRLDVFRSARAWKERSVSELLGPVFLQLERTQRAFKRWSGKNLYLEAKIIKEGNTIIRDLLLSRPHLIPPPLLEDAAKLIEHYDRWLEEFEATRSVGEPMLNQAFVFVGPQGYPFPKESEQAFKEVFRTFWKELYG
jgi:hypothetical protein